MSVRDAVRLFERRDQDNGNTRAILDSTGVPPAIPSASIQTSGEAPPPPLPSRLKPSTFLEDEPPPPLPSRPESSPKKRPTVPPKSKTVANKLATVQRTRNSREIVLIDLDDDKGTLPALQLIEPEPILEEPTAEDESPPPKPPRPKPRTPSPLSNVPRILRTVSDNTQVVVRNVQSNAPKTFQKVVKDATNQTQKAFSTIQAGVQRTVNGIPVPKAFAETREDFADLTKLQLGSPGICSRCATIPLERCFSIDSEESYTSWSTPLSRVALHAKWCRVCQLVLSMLCRTENDPLLLPEIKDYIQPEWLRGVPLHKWVSEGYIHQDEYWPFGRSKYRYEGSTQVLGPFSQELWEIAKRTSSIGVRALTRTAVRGGRRPEITRRDLQQTRSSAYKEGYQRGKVEESRYPISCVVLITVSGKQADTPGLLWVDLVGCGNKPGAEETALSHFMLKAVKNGFTANVSPGKALSYGHVLDPNWIDVSLGKLWLTECETTHGVKCSEHGWAVAMRKPTFLRLLDVTNLKIVAADDPAKCRYIALSYVWGGADVLKLRNTNLTALSQPNGLKRYLEDLPRTILDAMEVQEDVQESHEQIANMDAVYGSAILTIVAAGGEDANAGLSGVRRQHFTTANMSGIPRYIVQQSASVNNSIEVMAPISDGQDLDHSIWSSRAWTFQERFLSRRMLVFADNQVVWHCRGMIAREDMPVWETGNERPELDWLDLKPQYLGVGVDSHWKDGSLTTTRHGRTHVVRSGTFSEYCKMMLQYSSRNVTYDSDAINALAGLLRIFSLCFQAECIYGLPTNLLDIALLWRPIEPLSPRSGTFPSWSWAAWKGRIAYDHPAKIKQDESGHVLETEGVRPLLRYFRFDRHTGSLQPLNGTSRGLPLTDDELPIEWEAHQPVQGCQSETHTCTSPEIFDLDPRTIPHLSDKLLVFWTSATNSFNLESLAIQKVDQAWSSGGPSNRVSLVDLYSNQVGNLLLDGARLDYLEPGRHELILIAEAQSSLLDVETARGEYPYYLVMLVDTNPTTGISTRLGIGRVLKTAWIVAQPSLRLVCLG